VNELAGTSPPSISNLSLLSSFMDGSNILPSKLGLLDQLELLNLASNKFVGTVPTSLARMPSLGKPP